MNAVVAIGLAPFLGYIAAALGTTAAGWAMAVMLWQGSRSFGAAAAPDERFLTRLPRITGAALLMGACAWGLAAALAPWMQDGVERYLALGVLVAAAMVGYGLFARALGAFTVGELKSALRRG